MRKIFTRKTDVFVDLAASRLGFKACKRLKFICRVQTLLNSRHVFTRETSQHPSVEKSRKFSGLN